MRAKEFRREVKIRNLGNRVKIIPNLTEKSINELYKGASVVVRWGDEGFGMDILEGMANACPVVLNKELGASEIVEHGTHGFIVRLLYKFPKVSNKISIVFSIVFMKLIEGIAFMFGLVSSKLT